MGLDFVGRVASGQSALDHGIQGLEIVTTAQGTFLLSTSGATGGLVSYRLGATGPARIVDTQTFPDGLSETASQMINMLEIGGGLQAAIGSAQNGVMTGYALSQTGQIGATSTTMMLSGVSRAVDCAGLSMGGRAMVYTVDGETGRLSAHTEGRSTTVWRGGTDFDRVETVEIGGNAFVLATGAGMNGVVSYEVNGTTGALEQVDILGARDGLGVGIPTDMVTVSAHGSQFAVLAAAGSGSLTVMQVGSDGVLRTTDHLLDTLHTRFGNVQAVEAVEVDGQVFVAAGGGDDGLSLFSLLPDGRLVHLQSLAHDTGTGLMNVSQIAAARMGDSLQIMVGSQNAGGVAQFMLSLEDLGRVVTDHGRSVTLSGSADDDLIVSRWGSDTLLGNAGDDILVAGAGDTRMRGGAGADTFVLRDGGYTVRIDDFQAGIDRLDMSDYFFLRDLGQLQINSTNWGARIIFGDDRIDLHTMGGGALDAADIFGLFGMTTPTRMLPFDVTLEPDTPAVADTVFEPVPSDPAPAPPSDPAPSDGFDLSTIRSPFSINVPAAGGADPITSGPSGRTVLGTGGANSIRGGPNNDTMSLGAGHDRAWGNGGNDRLEGNAGTDTLDGGSGHDVLIGGSGDDILYGRFGHDIMRGGIGNDELRGHGGDDFLAGGDGADTLGGAGGNDTLLGGDGADTIWSGAGDDHVLGGPGDDLSTGFRGNDVMTGGRGNDRLWGGLGDDIVSGGAGRDVLGTGLGDDSVLGGSGGDRVFANFGDDLINGGSGNDTLFGGGDDDTIAGAIGDDRLGGAEGADVLLGNAGRDTLRGGMGDDTLLGGGDADTFIFASGEGHDLIVDFETDEDRIHVVTESGYGDLSISDTDAGDALITFSGGRVVLEGVTATDLSADDFLFG